MIRNIFDWIASWFVVGILLCLYWFDLLLEEIEASNPPRR